MIDMEYWSMTYGLIVAYIVGEPVEVKINGKWIKDRMEYDHKINNWYLVKGRLIGEQLEYLEVKI